MTVQYDIGCVGSGLVWAHWHQGNTHNGINAIIIELLSGPSQSPMSPPQFYVMFKSIFNSKYCLGSFTKHSQIEYKFTRDKLDAWSINGLGANDIPRTSIIRGWSVILMKIWFVFCITWNHSNFTVRSCIWILFRLTLDENYIENKINLLLFWFDLRSVTS